MLRKIYKCLGIYFFLSILIVSPVFAKDQLKDWNGQADIELQGNHRYKSVFIDKIIYQYAADDLRDLRIVDHQKKFIPFLIEEGRFSDTQNETYYDSVRIKVFTKKNRTYFDFKMTPLQKNVDIAGNKLVFEIPEFNFLKNIQLFGSYDGLKWEYLTAEQLYRVNQLKKNTINLSQTEKFLFYRLMIQDNAENIMISDLNLVDYRIRKDWGHFQRKTKLPYKIKNNAQDTTITFQNRHHLRIAALKLTVDGNFQRKYQLYQKDSKGDDIYLDSGEIYHLNFKNININSSEIDIKKSPNSAEQLSLKILNHDNLPLKIESIEILYFVDKLIFEATGQSPYLIYFGNPKANKPQYDMEKYRKYLLAEEQDKVKLLNFQVQDNKANDQPLLKNQQLIFNIVIVMIALILVVLLLGKVTRKV